MNLGLPVTRPDPIVEGFIRFFQIRPGILLKTPKLSQVVVAAVDGAFVLPTRHVLTRVLDLGRLFLLQLHHVLTSLCVARFPMR